MSIGEYTPQPPRQPTDGPVSVRNPDDAAGFTIEETHGGETRTITLSPHNAHRIFGMMAMMLGVKLPPKVAKDIKF